MRKFMMVMLIGLALGTTGFAQERGGFGGGHSAQSSRSFNGRGREGGGFSGHEDRGGRRGEGFSRDHDGYGIGLGFSGGPAPYVYAPAPYAPACYEYDPVYCPTVAGGIIVRRGFERERRFEHRDGDRHGFRP